MKRAVNQSQDLPPLDSSPHDICGFKPLHIGSLCFLDPSTFLMNAVMSLHMGHTAPIPCTERVRDKLVCAFTSPWAHCPDDLHIQAPLCQNNPQNVL